MRRCLILGAGGHGKVVAEILQQQGQTIFGFLDDDQDTWTQERLGIPVLGPIDVLNEYLPGAVILAIGSNERRKVLADRLSGTIDEFLINAIHPSAIISRSVVLGRGIVVAAGAVINAETLIDDHVIVNTGATIDHDCRIGAFSHIAPGANLAGTVKIGEGALVGIGASVIPGRSIGVRSVIGAGAAVVSDIPADVTAVGVPARLC